MTWVNLNHMLCPAISDPFASRWYRAAAFFYNHLLVPLIGKFFVLFARFLNSISDTGLLNPFPLPRAVSGSPLGCQSPPSSKTRRWRCSTPRPPSPSAPSPAPPTPPPATRGPASAPPPTSASGPPPHPAPQRPTSPCLPCSVPFLAAPLLYTL